MSAVESVFHQKSACQDDDINDDDDDQQVIGFFYFRQVSSFIAKLSVRQISIQCC